MSEIVTSKDAFQAIAPALHLDGQHITEVVIELRVNEPALVTVRSFLGAEEAAALGRAMKRYELVEKSDQP